MCMVHMGDLLHWFSSVTLSWLEPSLSFEISVHDSRTVPILHQLWVKRDLFSWISGHWWFLWKQLLFCISWLLAGTRGTLPLWECTMGIASGRVISLRSAVAPAPACVHGTLSLLCYLCHRGVYFIEGVPSATLYVQLPKTHLHTIQLCQACLDFLLCGCAWRKSLK